MGTISSPRLPHRVCSRFDEIEVFSVVGMAKWGTGEDVAYPPVDSIEVGMLKSCA